MLRLFCYIFAHEFLFNPYFDLEPDYIIRKPIVHSLTEFNHTFCVGKYCQLFTHKSIVDQYYEQYAISPFKSMEPKFRKMPEPCQKQPLPLEARGLPSNTWMPGPAPLTAPNDSSIALRNSTQRRNKVPIGYNGTPQIHPQTTPDVQSHEHSTL